MPQARVIMRPPSDAFSRALSQHPQRDRIDPQRAAAQHAAYAAALRAHGVDVVMLAPEPQLPDAPFTSDTLLAFRHDGTTSLVLTRPGEPARRAEVASVGAAARRLAPGAAAHEVVSPGTLDGGDVLVYGRRVAIGVSRRTNAEGAGQLAEILRSLGFTVFLCPVERYLHLASAVTALSDRRLVGTPCGFASLDAAGALTEDLERIVIPEEEVAAANVLALAGRSFVPAGYPGRTRALREANETVIEVELDEFIRADGGPTCLVAPVA